MLSNTGSTETFVKYVVYRLPAIAAILFYWIMMKVVQQLTGLLDRWAVEHDPGVLRLSTTQLISNLQQLAAKLTSACLRGLHVKDLYLGGCGRSHRASSCGRVWCSCCGDQCWAWRWQTQGGKRCQHDGTDALSPRYIQRSSQQTPTICTACKGKGKGAYSSSWNSPQNNGTSLVNRITQYYLLWYLCVCQSHIVQFALELITVATIISVNCRYVT